jgi:hypothetical protein
MKKIHRRNILFCCVLIFLIARCKESRAQNNFAPVSPLLTGHYTPGVMNIRDLADPAPASGLLFLDYNIIQSGNQFYGRDGIR